MVTLLPQFHKQSQDVSQSGQQFHVSIRKITILLYKRYKSGREEEELPSQVCLTW